MPPPLAPLAIEANRHKIVTVELTTDGVGDITAVPDLLDQKTVHLHR